MLYLITVNGKEKEQLKIKPICSKLGFCSYNFVLPVVIREEPFL
jgi:hypothetical protein